MEIYSPTLYLLHVYEDFSILNRLYRKSFVWNHNLLGYKFLIETSWHDKCCFSRNQQFLHKVGCSTHNNGWFLGKCVKKGLFNYLYDNECGTELHKHSEKVNKLLKFLKKTIWTLVVKNIPTHFSCHNTRGFKVGRYPVLLPVWDRV